MKKKTLDRIKMKLKKENAFTVYIVNMKYKKCKRKPWIELK